MPFVKGQSGNPGGRPKENNEIKELARAHSVEAFERICEMAQCADHKIALPACKEILDRAYGKPAQAITGEDGGPVALTGLTVTFVRPDQSGN